MTILFNSQQYTEIGIFIIYLGLSGILLNKTNILVSIISIEIMFYGINYYSLTISLILQDIKGLAISIIILTLAAAESAIALALLMMYFKVFKNILL